MEDSMMEIDIRKELITAHGRIKFHIEASFPLGELIVLFGNSGAGKTTLLRIISGLTKPEQGFIKVGGSIWLDTKSGIDLKPQERNIGFMFQDYALFPNMTVFENISFADSSKKFAYSHILLEKFGLTEFANRKPGKLSGGQKQRVALARALVRKPRLLLLDEPLSALDSKTRMALQDEISLAHSLTGTTTLLVSHDLAEVFRLAHKVIKIEGGRVAACGKPEEIFINNRISGKVQLTGSIVKIEKQDTFFLLTVITGVNQVIRVTAFEDDIKELQEGDQVMVFSKAFNPLIKKIQN